MKALFAVMINKPTAPPEFVKTWAGKIKQMGLTTPAILLLETHKPLSFVIGQFVLLGQPILNTLLPAHFISDTVNLFSNRTYLDHLIQELEER
jgi:hypothetical protein